MRQVDPVLPDGLTAVSLPGKASSELKHDYFFLEYMFFI